jgi:hypothetical protein
MIIRSIVEDARVLDNRRLSRSVYLHGQRVMQKANALGAEIPELSLLCSRGQFAGEPDHLAE